MKKTLCAVLLLFFGLSFFARIGGALPLQGRITSLNKKDTLYLATVRMDKAPSTSKDPADKVAPGMSVKIIYSISTSQFRLPVGRVLEVKENGDVVVAIQESLLDKEVADPNSDQVTTVRSLLVVGADVSVSSESL
jgi:hypothetical protein